MSKLIGQLIDNRYQIERAIGHGGMATVYLAKDISFGRDVAVKIMNDPASMYEGFGVEKFRQEAQLVASLEHHAIVPVYDFGTHNDRPYLVMRLMQGGTLKERLALNTLDLDGVGTILKRICSALDKAHSKHVVHRDIKPGNILFDEEGMPYLADFGIARLTNRTQTVSLIGSPRYMAPEQAKSEPLSPQTDIYQMGVVLFHMLTGRVPYDADTTESVLYQHVYQPIPRIAELAPRLPIQLEAVIETALAKIPEERYPSAGALSKAFQTVTGREPSKGIPKPPPISQETIDYQSVYETATLPPERVARSQTTKMPEGFDTEVQPTPAVPPAAYDYPAPEQPPQAPRRTPWGWIAVLSVLGIGLFVCGAVIIAFNNPNLIGAFAQPTAEPVVIIPTLDLGETPETGESGEPEIAPTATLPGDEEDEPDDDVVESFLTLDPETMAALGGGNGQLAFAANLSDDDPNAFDLFIVDENGARRQLTTHAGADFRPVFSPDGSKIAYHSLDDTWDIYIMNSDGSGRQRLTTHPRDDSFPTWSPDGTQIAFHSNRFEVQFDIWVADLTTGETTRLTTSSQNELGASFSPDGAEIAFYRQMEDGSRQIFVMDADGSNERQLTSADNFSEYPMWSPDGERLTFFSTRDGTAQVYTMNAADGSDVQQLTNSLLGAFYPSYTSNGEWIVFHSIAEGTNREIYMIRNNGSEVVQLTDTEEQERLPMWQP